ncbi:DUF4192 family protein [Kitasatospora sp. NPDC048365]|uniref:DUF4192 family protein n=1 Tax=Kitasatospora sp. NPDC048365 TaxID=3364050 RepID=UPI00371ADBBC
MNDDRGTMPSAQIPGFLPVRMRGPADMAEMLPYLLGFFPDDSIVAVGLMGPALEQGGVIRIDIPEDAARWSRVAEDAARLLVELSEQRGRRPDQVLLYLCRDPDPDGEAEPDPGGSLGPDRRSDRGSDRGPDPRAEGRAGGPAVLARLQPLARALARAFENEGVVVKESLCISAGRWRSFLCTGASCCDPDGTPVRPAHLPSPLAAAATFAGLAPRGSRKAIVAGLAPVGPPVSDVQRRAIEEAGPPFIRELTGPRGRAGTVDRTGELIAEAMAAFGAGAKGLDAAQTARLLVGLQDKLGRDRGAEYAEPHELVPAQRLWRFLIQRCVPPFDYLATPPMTLLAWASWLGGDSATARIVLSRALDLDPGYTLAQLLYESLNGGLTPEKLLEAVRRERSERIRHSGTGRPEGGAVEAPGMPDGRGGPEGPKPRTPEGPVGPESPDGPDGPVTPAGPDRGDRADPGLPAASGAGEEAGGVRRAGAGERGAGPGAGARCRGSPDAGGDPGGGQPPELPGPGEDGPPVGDAAAGARRSARRRIRLRVRQAAEQGAEIPGPDRGKPRGRAGGGRSR